MISNELSKNSEIKCKQDRRKYVFLYIAVYTIYTEDSFYFIYKKQKNSKYYKYVFSIQNIVQYKQVHNLSTSYVVAKH